MERVEEKDGVGGGEGWSERRGESREQREENEATKKAKALQAVILYTPTVLGTAANSHNTHTITTTHPALPRVGHTISLHTPQPSCI